MAESTCIVLPLLMVRRQGTVLQEGAANGRAILVTCDTYGCKENVEGRRYNGFLVRVADPESLICAMEEFIKIIS